MVLTLFGTVATLLLLCSLTYYVSPKMQDIAWVFSSFGASVVLVFCVPESKHRQPRNFLGGQLVGAIVGVSIRLAFDGPTAFWTFISGPIATGLAITLMQLSKTTHPPGGGTALAIGLLPSLSKTLGWTLVATVALGSVLFLLCGILTNNLSPERQFPTFWINQKL